MMLVDTSVWIEFFRGNNTHQVLFFQNAIHKRQEIFLCGVILTELLQGITNEKEYKLVSSSLTPFTYLDMSRDTYILAAELYRTLRAKGITTRKTIDCMIAAVAIEHNLALLHKDKDFIPIEKHCGLKNALHYQ